MPPRPRWHPPVPGRAPGAPRARHRGWSAPRRARPGRARRRARPSPRSRWRRRPSRPGSPAGTRARWRTASPAAADRSPGPHRSCHASRRPPDKALARRPARPPTHSPTRLRHAHRGSCRGCATRAPRSGYRAYRARCAAAFRPRAEAAWAPCRRGRRRTASTTTRCLRAPARPRRTRPTAIGTSVAACASHPAPRGSCGEYGAQTKSGPKPAFRGVQRWRGGITRPSPRLLPRPSSTGGCGPACRPPAP